MVSLIVLGLAVALLIAHLVDGRVPRGYVLAAFIMSAIVAAGDLREPAGQTCTTYTTTVTTSDPLGGAVAVAEIRPVETCVTSYTVNMEALVALIVSITFAILALVFEMLGRLERAAGWTT